MNYNESQVTITHSFQEKVKNNTSRTFLDQWMLESNTFLFKRWEANGTAIKNKEEELFSELPNKVLTPDLRRYAATLTPSQNNRPTTQSKEKN